MIPRIRNGMQSFCPQSGAFFTTTPLTTAYGTTETTLFDERFRLLPDSKNLVLVDFNIAAERVAKGFDTYRLYVDGVQVTQAGFESEFTIRAPDYDTSYIVWGDVKSCANHCHIRVTAQSSEGISNVNSTGPFAKIAALSVIIINTDQPRMKLCSRKKIQCIAPFRDTTFITYDTEPLSLAYFSETDLFDKTIPLDVEKEHLVLVDFSISAQRTLVGFDTYRLYIDGTIVNRAGYESEFGQAPNLNTSGLTWGGLRENVSSIDIRVTGQSSNGISNVNNSTGAFDGSKGVALRILVLPILTPTKPASQSVLCNPHCQVLKYDCEPQNNQIFFSNQPLVLTYGPIPLTLFQESFQLRSNKTSLIFVRFDISAQRANSSGFDIYRLFIDNVLVNQGGYESEIGSPFAPNLNASSLVFSGQRIGGDVTLHVTAQSNVGISNVDNNSGLFQGSKEAALRVLIYELP